ncbi:replication initiator protein A [Staphylococcus equorum]|uniref:replication initiator protein A n=1 Tax=Staphylococcus equorum TaxID=246432 RepID=UPI003F57CED4
MSNKFYIQENFRERFYQLPKVFFTNPNYQKLSNDAKIAYALLRDRLNLSIKNKWVDSDNAIYFIYTNENLESILNVSKPKVIKIKKELENVDLLEQKRLGLNKPNMLYLMKPEVTENDIYQIQEEETPSETSNDKEVNNFNFQKSKSLTSRGKKNSLQEVNQINSNDTDFSNTDYIENEFNDMNDMNDNQFSNQAHTNHTNHNTQQFDDESIKYLELQEFPELLKGYLTNFNIQDLKTIKTVILKSKKSFNSSIDIGMPYRLEDMELELLSVLKRFKARLIQKNETVISMQGYLMHSIKTELEEMHSLKQRQASF